MRKHWMPALGILKGVNCAVDHFSEFEKNWIDTQSKKIAIYLNHQIKGDYITELKMEYGSRKALSDLTKASVMILISLLTGTVTEALLVMLTYRSLVSVTRGVHANTSIKCLGFSLFFFTLLPIVCQSMEITFWHCGVVILFMLMAIERYVPVCNHAYQMKITTDQKKMIKKKAIIRTLIIGLMAALCPIKIVSTMILLGLSVALLALLPITKKIMNRERK